MKKIVLFLLLLSGLNGSPAAVFAQTRQNISIEDIFVKGTFSQKSVYGLNSMKDGKSYVSIQTDPSGNRFVAKQNFSDGKTAKVLYYAKDVQYKGKVLPPGVTFNDQESKVLIADEVEDIYRRSSRANYYVYDLAKKEVIPVSESGKQMFATFSPDGSKVAFVKNNNIFIKDLVSLQEKQITSDGKYNHIINGHGDWVYEEEFSFARAFFWSPDNSSIAYCRFDEIEVPEYSMTVFDRAYNSEYRYKYPRAGEKNSRVSVHIYHLNSGKTVTADIGREKDLYIPKIQWTERPATLSVIRMNRHQNQMDLLMVNASNGQSKTILKETDKYYIDIDNQLFTFLPGNKHFLLSSERDGYNHLYLYNLDGKLVRQVTKGPWEVTTVYGIDPVKKRIYYQSTEKSPLQRDIYSIGLDGKEKKLLSSQRGTNYATFSSDFSYFVLNHSSANSPSYITLNDNSGKTVRLLEDNAELKEKLKQYGNNKTEFFSFKTSEGVNLNGFMLKPEDFDPAKKYPVMMFVYGGPGSQNVADSWGGGRHQWNRMLTQKGYIVVCVDNRGTGFRGAEFKKMTYLNLGKYETMDQIEAARWLGRQSYVDASRIGIWGWSYGGYMSSLCLTKGADVFKMGIAVAPVTIWKFYDSIYTERYMRTPQENNAGYEDNSPINFADRLKGKFLLIHGTADDNVHFQNSVLFSEALIQKNKAFEQAYYPNKNHNISGGVTSVHLYTKLTDFILNNL